MLLSRKSSVRISADYANIVGHLCYAASKLWNVCNYERQHYKELELPEYPDWYYQKKAHKADFWYKQLPSQTAQELCKQLDGAWKSFYTLIKTGGIENPQPPRFKHDPMAITYIQKAISHDVGSDTLRLSLPRQMMGYLSEAYGICDKYLYLKNKIFEDTDTIKQLKIYPPKNGVCDIIVVYEIPDVELLPDNGKYLSIDLGLHNLMTCYDSETSDTFIVGRKYLSICRYYDKEIERVQSQWYRGQYLHGIEHPKSSKHISALYAKKKHCVQDYLHKCARYIVTYCQANDIRTVVVGDLTGIREDNRKGNVFNQQMHSLPYRQLYLMLSYKLALEGIRFVMQNEAYSSQCSPLVDTISVETAHKENRVQRGLYIDDGHTWNADCVGAFNILRLYYTEAGILKQPDPYAIKNPYVAKVAV
jgi:putative transposase